MADKKSTIKKIYLSEEQIPRYWYNIAADMKEKPDRKSTRLNSSHAT